MKPKIWQYSAWVTMPLDGDQDLHIALAKLISSSGHSVLEATSHEFTPQGLTALWLLQESHLALHTWPECGVAYVQLSSCSEEKANNFAKGFAQLFTGKMQQVENAAYDPYKLIN